MPIPRRARFTCWSLLIAAIALPSLRAADIDQLIAEVRSSIPADDLAEPGNTALAKAIDELADDQGIGADDRRALRLHAAEAWLLAGDGATATVRAEAVLADAKATPAERDRAGLALVAAWQIAVRSAEKPEEVASAVDAVAKYGDLGAKVAARARSAEGERRLQLKDPDGAIQRFDEALALLKDAPPAERVPLCALRLLAMEAKKVDADEIQKWLADHSSDPAWQQVAESALTGSQRLVGQQAPPIATKRLDEPGAWTLASLKGKIVLLDFFATWAQPCHGVAPVVVAYAAAHPDIAVIGVSLDTKDSLPNLAAYRAKYGITYPIVGDGLGWDGEIDDAFHVEGIPHLVLIGADGRIAAVDLLVPDDGKATTAAIDAVVARLTGKGDVVPPPAATPHDEAPLP